MKLAVKHNLVVMDPQGDEARPESSLVLSVAEAEAAMGETIADVIARTGWRFDLPTVCRINGLYYSRWSF
jgi:hypothetical protein